MGYVYLGQSRIASIFKELPVETLIDKLCNKSAIEILDIPEGVSAIGDYLFYKCPNLTNVIIPASVKYIGEEAFYNSDNIEVIDFNGLPPSTVGENAFPSTIGTYRSEFQQEWEAAIDSPYNSWNNLTMEEYVPLETIVTYSDGSTKSFLIEGELTTQISSVQTATEIKIGKAVTSIRSSAFSSCSSLISVTIPSSVSKVGQYTFNNCKSLTSVTIHKGVTSIGYSAFSGCSSLTSVTIPSSVTTIGAYAFQSCSSLTSITIPNSVTSIGPAAFWGCSSLTSVTIPEGVTSIGYHTFYECTSLTTVTIPSSVTNINEYAFAYCSSLTSVTISEGVTSIGEMVFYSCTSLTSVVIPSSVTSIGNNTFYNCSSLTSITFEGNPPTSVGTNAFKTNNTNTIGYYLSENKAAWEAVIVDGKWQGMTMEEYVPLETIVTYSDGSTSSFLIEGEIVGRSSSPYYTTQISSVQNATEIKIGKAVTSIGSYTFRNCTSLISMTIPEGVTKIGQYAFNDCSSLTSMTIPEGVTSIGNYAFYDCTGLTSVMIPEGVTFIGSYSFNGCSSLTSITIPASVTSIGDEPITRCNSLISLIVDSENQKYSSINNLLCNKSGKLIKACPGGLTSVIIPEGVTSIGSYAFYNCAKLTSVTIPEGVTSISDGAFEYCSSLTSLTIPSTVTTLSNRAFEGCKSLTSVMILEGVRSIGLNVFRNCSSLTSITIPSSMTSMGNQSFFGCNKLAEVTISDLLAWCKIRFSNVAGSPFYYSSAKLYLNNELITNLVIPSGVTSIGNSQFYGCRSLTSVTIPEGVTSIATYAFSNCTGLTSIEIPSSVTSIGEKAFYSCIRLPSITIPNKVTSIGSQAFSSCSKLTLITFEGNPPTSVGTSAFPTSNANLIGYYAFENATAWEAVIVDGKWNGITMKADWPLSTIVKYSDGSTKSFLIEGELTGSNIEILMPTPTTQIDNVQNATEIIIGKAVTSIKNAAFVECISLISVMIPDSVTEIGESAFHSCTSLTSVTIPPSVTSIGSYAFAYCSSLTSVPIPSSVTGIGNCAFYDCTSLTSVTIPNSVTTIGGSVFSDCSSLTSITFGGNPPASVGSTPFPTSNENLVGYYTSSAWEAVIVDGKWNGITMSLIPITYSTGGNGTWTESNGEWTSPTISHSQSAYFQAEFSGEKTLSFTWKVSSESNYDWLTLYIDGTQITRISGTKDWATVTKTITGTGDHIVKWTYSKDGSQSSGSDKGWVKDISIT